MGPYVFQDFFVSEHHLILSGIFLKLDAHSLRTCKLVHSSWHRFITDFLYMIPSARPKLTRILQEQWCAAKPDISSVHLLQSLFHLEADSKNIICGMHSGEIEIRNTQNLKVDKVLSSRNQNCYTRVTMNAGYIVSGFFNRTLSLWKREGEHSLVHEIQMDYSIYSLKITPGGKVVVSMVNGDIQTLIVTEESRLRKKWRFIGTFPRMLHNFDCDDRRVFCGSNNGVVSSWNLISGEKDFTVSTEHKVIQTFVYRSRGITLCKVDALNSLIRIWDLDKGESLIDFHIERVRSCSLYDNRFAVLTDERFSILFIDNFSQGLIDNSNIQLDKKVPWIGCRALRDRLISFNGSKQIFSLNFWKGNVIQSNSNSEVDQSHCSLKFVKKLYIC